MFDEATFELSIKEKTARIKAQTAAHLARKCGEIKLAKEIADQSLLAAKRLNMVGWPAGTFEAYMSPRNYLIDKKAVRGKLLLIFGEEWDGNVNAPDTVGQKSLWLGKDGLLYGRTATFAEEDLLYATPFGAYKNERLQYLLSSRDGDVILATLRALGTT